MSREFTGTATLLIVQQLHPPQQLQKLSKWCWFAATELVYETKFNFKYTKLSVWKKNKRFPGLMSQVYLCAKD